MVLGGSLAVIPGGHVATVTRGMMIPVTLVYQPIFDVTATPSPFSAAITGSFMPIQTCRQHL
jgi:hypothetical protein